MSVIQEKNKKKWTKDGRSWYYDVYYIDITGIRREKKSKLYASKSIAKEEERKFLNTIYDHKVNITNMTFKDLYDSFYEYKKDKVRDSTIKTYRDRIIYLEILQNIKLKDLNIQHIEMWKRKMNEFPLALSYKNDIFKFVKAILNYGTKFYDFNFSQVYNKMEKFSDPNELPKEMLFYTFKEFSQFISVEKDLKWKTLFETLYYMGLRKGELRGLQWKDVNFEKKTINITKQIPSIYNNKSYKITPLKTKKSNRELPLNSIVYNDLKLLFEENNKYSNFSSEWFVFGNIFPIAKEPIRDRKKIICSQSGVKEIRIHDFRHSCASLLINNGANITIVAKYLGHTKIDETLNTYAHMFKSKLEDIVNLIDNIANEKTIKIDQNNLEENFENKVIDLVNSLLTKGYSGESITKVLKEFEANFIKK